MSWFAVRLESRRERIALRFLDMTGHVVYAPRVGVTRVIRGRPIEHHRLLFPGYVFAGAVEQWGALRRVPGVVGPVGCNGGGPALIDDAVVDAIRSREHADGLIDLKPVSRRERRRLRPGDAARVISGLFIGRDGAVEALTARDRVRVALDALGVVVELPESDVMWTGRRRHRNPFTRGWPT